jgi:nicastrin
MVIIGTVLLLAVRLLPMACGAPRAEGRDPWYQPDIGQIHDARSLEAALYTSSNDGSGTGADADACVLLLHANGKVGCGEREKNAKGPLLLVQESALHNARHYDLQNNVAVVVPAVDAGQLLIKLLTSNDSLPTTVGAVLIEFSESFPGWNPAQQNPLDEYKPEDFASGPGSVPNMTAVWNIAGLGLDNTSFPFAIFQLSNSTSSIARLRAQDNMNRLGQGLDPSKHDFHFVDIDVRMDAANSTSCIADNTCLPLGGSSVFAALPPLRHNASPDEKVILVVAQADAPPGLFHELAVGANAPLSGLVAVLAAARSLGRQIKRSSELSVRKQIVFAALRGESFGFMASRRLLWESYDFMSSSHFNHTRPPLIFKQDTIDTLIEVGSVGQSRQTMRRETDLFAHAHKTGPEVIDAMQQAATADQDHLVRLGIRPSDRYSVPPSSTWSFLRINKNTPAIVLTESDTLFADPAYASPWDRNISVKAVATAAVLLARTLESLAFGANGPVREEIDGAVVEEDVAQLVDCLVVSGLEKCELSQQMMTLHREPTKSHYLGILRTVAKGIC